MSETTHPRTYPRRRAAGTSRDVQQDSSGIDHRRAISFLLLVLCLAALGAGAAGVLRVRTVEVIGTNVPVNQIALASGASGQNIFTVRTDAVVTRLEQVPSIQVSRVETAFPDRIIVYAERRQPVIAWQSTEGLHLIDATGRMIGQVKTTALPVVTGGVQAPDAAMVAAVQYSVKVLPGAPNGAIGQLTLDRKTGLGVTGKAGWKADLGFGNAETLVRRVATLVSILQAAQTQQQQVTFIDLRNKEPYYRIVGGLPTPTPTPTIVS